MRLKPAKVDYLAKRIADAIQKMNRMEFAVPAEQVEGAVRRVITEDLRREDELEKEAEEILRIHRQKIDMRNLSYNTMVQKAKQELARKKKIIL